MSLTDVQLVIYDFSGVLAEEGFYLGLQAIAQRYDLNPDKFVDMGVDAVYASGYITGTGNEADFWNLLKDWSGLPEVLPGFVQEILKRFVVRPAMIDSVRQLRSCGYKTAILSDHTDWLDRLDAQYSFFKEFNRVFNSYYLGKGKRDPDLFVKIVATCGVEPHQALFIDDNPGHIQRAAAQGLNVHLFVSQAEFFKVIDPLLGK